MGTIHKHSTQSRNLDIMTNKNWTCIKMYKNIRFRNNKTAGAIMQNMSMVDFTDL